MSSAGSGVYFDGRTNARHDVRVELLAGALRIVASDGRAFAEWPLSELHEVHGYLGGVRLTREGAEPAARLDIRDEPFAAEVRRASPSLNGGRRRGVERRVLLWSLAAIVSFGLLALYGVPILADRVTPLLPWSVDARMGATLDGQIRALLPVREGGFACGDRPGEQPGRAALDALQRKLADAAGLPARIDIVAVRSDFVNALALPGGTIYLFDGLVGRAENGDELAGVLAHEIGHVAARDGTRRALQAGGVSFLFGFVLGDFLGGGAAVAVIRELSEASYSRHAESEADLYAVRLMGKLGADQKALGRMLSRLGAQDKDGARSAFDYLSSHPATGERRAAIDAAATAGPATPMLSAEQFSALKRICGGRA